MSAGNVHGLREGGRRVASAALALPPAAASRSLPSARNSSPCACWRWLLLCYRPNPLVPASALQPLKPAVVPAGTVLPALSNEASEIPISSGNPVDSPLPVPGKPRLPPDDSHSATRNTLPRNSLTPESSSSCAGDTVVGLDLPLHITLRSQRGPTDPPHPTHSRPDDSPAAIHEGLVVATDLVQEGSSCKSSP